jgi:hypothetical protein
MSLGYRKTLMRTFMVKSKLEPLRLHALLPETVEDAKKAIIEYIDEHPHCRADNAEDVMKKVLADFQKYHDDTNKYMDLRPKKSGKLSSSDDEEPERPPPPPPPKPKPKHAKPPQDTTPPRPSRADLEEEIAALKAHIAELEGTPTEPQTEE